MKGVLFLFGLLIVVVCSGAVTDSTNIVSAPAAFKSLSVCGNPSKHTFVYRGYSGWDVRHLFSAIVVNVSNVAEVKYAVHCFRFLIPTYSFRISGMDSEKGFGLGVSAFIANFISYILSSDEYTVTFLPPVGEFDVEVTCKRYSGDLSISIDEGSFLYCCL